MQMSTETLQSHHPHPKKNSLILLYFSELSGADGSLSTTFLVKDCMKDRYFPLNNSNFSASLNKSLKWKTAITFLTKKLKTSQHHLPLSKDN